MFCTTLGLVEVVACASVGLATEASLFSSSAGGFVVFAYAVAWACPAVASWYNFYNIS